MTSQDTQPPATTDTQQPPLQIMDPHQSEPRLHPFDDLWIAWIHERQLEGFSFYKFDITFNSSGHQRSTEWLNYFDRNVVYKIQKVIGAGRTILTDIREYEFGIRSRNRVTADWRCPHHIHALIGVPTAQGSRMMSKRLKKDLESLAEVSSVYIDLIPDNDTNPSKTVRAAYAYMRKGKTHRPLGAD